MVELDESAIAETEAALQFYIPATASLHDGQLRTLKHADTVVLLDRFGDVVNSGRLLGLYHRDTRYLSKLELTVNNRRPLLLSSNLQPDDSLLAIDLTNPDFYFGSHLILSRDTVHLSRSIFVWDRVCYQRIELRSYSDRRHALTLRFRFGSDFADVFEVRGLARDRRGQTLVTVLDRASVLIAYDGLDQLRRETRLVFSPTPYRLTRSEAVLRVSLDPGQRCALVISAGCDTPDIGTAPRKRILSALREQRRARLKVAGRQARVDSSNPVFSQLAARSLSDLAMLSTETEHGRYPYAGIPWFSTVFGRDGIITAIELLWLDPDLAQGVLRYLAATQARDRNPLTEAEPGKILHECRVCEMANLGEVPFGRYYGSVDATPLFVMLAGLYWQRTGDTALLRELWPNIQAALAWIDRDGDIDGDGFVEYAPKSTKGLVNQGWKDSHDSVFHDDGQLAEGPIALVEVQAYVYAAKCHAAVIAAELGFVERASTLARQAENLRVKFEASFWLEEIGTYALALDGQKKPCAVRTSNAGHALFGGIASEARAKRVASTLLGSSCFSGWGIRTLATNEKRYNPMSYHNGSVWPHDNALIALGFSRYGLTEQAAQVFTALFDAAIRFEFRRLPELFCGFLRRRHTAPTSYPVACAPQAWSSAAPFALLQACLGLEFQTSSSEVRFRRPRMPRFVDEITISGLQFNGAALDVDIRRGRVDASVNVTPRDGHVPVVVKL